MEQKVHINIEVIYRGDKGIIYLVPGQAFPVPFSFKGKEDVGLVEIKSYVSLWEWNDRIYTDITPGPLYIGYLKRERLDLVNNTHSTRDGFGITSYDVSRSNIQGRFNRREREVYSYPLRLALEHNNHARYVSCPACVIYMMPEMYVKLTDHAPYKRGDVKLYDILTHRVCRFRRAFMPIVLGKFDPVHHPVRWQKKLISEDMSPMHLKGYLLKMKLEEAGHSIYDTDFWYLAYPVSKRPCSRIHHRSPKERMIAVAPYIKGDALAPIDIGRKRVFSWEGMWDHRFN